MKSKPIEYAMVLAAGRGERMRPLSDVLPKPALALADGPVIASPINSAAKIGVSRIVINTWHLGDKMAEAISGIEHKGVEILLSPEDGLRGTAGGLALARDRGLLGENGPILVLNGDGILGLETGSLIEHHRQTNDLVTLALLPHLAPKRWSRVVLDAADHVDGILPPGAPEAEEVPFLYPGVMLVSRTALDALPASAGDVPRLLWQPAQEAGRLGGVVIPGHWKEVGTPNDYREVALQRLGSESYIHPSAEVHPSVTVETAFIGKGSRIESGSVIKESVVGEGAVVRNGARVFRSILLGAVIAESEESVEEQVRAIAH